MSEHQRLPDTGTNKPERESYRGGLARPVAAEQTNHFSRRDIEGEQAQITPRKPDPEPEDVLPMEDVETPDATTIEALASFLGMPRSRTAKAAFFGNRGNVFHVGIYVGEGRFVHAPSTGGTVRLDSLGGSYWKDHYTGAKRVLH